MFRVSRRVDYGLRLLIALAADPNMGPQSTANLAEKLDIPLAFLHQIGRSLIQAGLVKASPGPGGGLRLNRAAETISLRHVMEILEGPIKLNNGPEGTEECLPEQLCNTQEVWDQIQSHLVNQLDNIRLNGLVETEAGRLTGAMAAD